MRHLAPPTLVIPRTIDVGPLNPGGTVDQHMLNVFFWMFWISVVVGVGVSGAILFACFRFRRRRPDEMPRQTHGKNWLEVTWTVIPFVIVMSLFGLSTANMSYVISQPTSANGNQAVQVTVVGEQFDWTYVYTGLKDSSGALVRDGVLYVPANTPIDLQVVSFDSSYVNADGGNTSIPVKSTGCFDQPFPSIQDGNAQITADQFQITKDQSNPQALATDKAKLATDQGNMIPTKLMFQNGDSFAQAVAQQGCGVNHSFFIPSLGGQINAIPGQINQMWFDANLDNGKEAHYWGQCTELCGWGHDKMIIEVVALPMNEWKACSGSNFGAQSQWAESCLQKFPASKGVPYQPPQ